MKGRRSDTTGPNPAEAARNTSSAVGAQSLRAIFDSVSDLTVGAEEELLLLDPVTFELAYTAEAVLAELGQPDRFRAELSSAQIEIVSGVCRDGAQVCAELKTARSQLIATLGGRFRIAGLGTHPFSSPWSELSEGDRYREIASDHPLGARLGALASGLHVHVAVAGSDRALAVYNAMRGLAPLITALGANAPFIAGRDSGMATVRPMLSDALPRQGVGPRFSSWIDLSDHVRWAVDSGAVADVSRFWWECRLNPRLGTVEMRAPDAQSSVDDTYALVTVIHAATADLCERFDDGEDLPAFETLRIQENRWRAARFGIRGHLIDLNGGGMAPTQILVSALLDRIEGAAKRCGAAMGIDLARAMVERDLPAWHRELAVHSGPHAIVRWAADQAELPFGIEFPASG
jgi:carboxylate-amine ligase